MKNLPEGSSPKKFIKYTHNRNPSLHSYHLKDVLHPEIEQATHVKTKMIRQVSEKVNPRIESLILEKDSNQYKKDSLFQFEQQFNNRKKSYPILPALTDISPREDEIVKGPVSGMRSYKSTNSVQSKALSNIFNFKDSLAIKNKQNIGYNIISNVPFH